MSVLSNITILYVLCFDTVYDPYVIFDVLLLYFSWNCHKTQPDAGGRSVACPLPIELPLNTLMLIENRTLSPFLIFMTVLKQEGQ